MNDNNSSLKSFDNFDSEITKIKEKLEDVTEKKLDSVKSEIKKNPTNDAKSLVQEKHDEEIANSKADRDLRERYGFKAYKVVKKSLWGWAILLTLYALCRFFFNKDLFSDNVLIAITSATTLNIFAAFLGVIRGLFPVNTKS
ncbi:hypothetical protein BHC43_09130 [Snodgrassella alvi]|uniref:hypothetical protein n=1 Tax=Snodgrassella alvi TaxID=1196083 RepID=UPI000C1F637C|nr:hypothetical protein [Snodgrassella alvi]PIT36281.1 hypothetical protein BHC43_09130 [Snodgrassella alvi]